MLKPYETLLRETHFLLTSFDLENLFIFSKTMNYQKTKPQRIQQKTFTESVLQAHRNDEKRRLQSKPQEHPIDVPLININGVLMNPRESAKYLMARLRDYERALESTGDVQLVCPTCKGLQG